jgi:PST family polysaccharide transporter
VKNSYGTIFRSTTIIGGSQVVKILISIAQTKILALLLGPSGVGLVGLYNATIGIGKLVCGVGIRQSGVRQVAKAASTGDRRKIGRTVFAVRLTTMVFGILGAFLFFFLRNYISTATFGNSEHGDAFGLLALIIFFASLTAGQTALVQGMRRVGDLARLEVLGAFWGAFFGLPILYLLRVEGIAPYLAVIAGTTLAASWLYARKISVAAFGLSIKEIWSESKNLISLGILLMISALLGRLVIYLTRVAVLREFGIDGVGLFQAATNLSNIYVGFILGAMGMDFFPRLSAVSQDHPACNQLVNEQAEIGLLMASPGLLATLTFAPLAIRLFYSAEFIPAYEILQWQVLGTFIRVASWPMAFIQLAKGFGKLYFMTQLTANVLHLLLIWLAIHHFGLLGTGIAFFGLYVFYLFFVYAIVRSLSGFAWSKSNMLLGMIIAPSVFLVFLFMHFLPSVWGIAFGLFSTIAMGFFCLKRLHNLIGSPLLPRLVAKTDRS